MKPIKEQVSDTAALANHIKAIWACGMLVAAGLVGSVVWATDLDRAMKQVPIHDKMLQQQQLIIELQQQQLQHFERDAENYRKAQGEKLDLIIKMMEQRQQ